jgi:hypothetical protein
MSLRIFARRGTALDQVFDVLLKMSLQPTLIRASHNARRSLRATEIQYQMD